MTEGSFFAQQTTTNNPSGLPQAATHLPLHKGGIGAVIVGSYGNIVGASECLPLEGKVGRSAAESRMRCLYFLLKYIKSPHQSAIADSFPSRGSQFRHRQWRWIKLRCHGDGLRRFCRHFRNRAPAKGVSVGASRRIAPAAAAGEQCSPLQTLRNCRLKSNSWVARQLRFPPHPRYRATAIDVSVGALKRDQKKEWEEWLIFCRKYL